ncbi:MAG: glycosyltransferase family 4 protein [Planctomycetes bacterium]|nr:glycosyltransferase family 4 protein [Planctomycetota bacterium]
MKVALNIEYFCPSKGGGQTYAANFARALVAKGHEVHVFACEAEDIGPEITFHRLRALRGLRALRDWSFVKASTLALQEQEFDIIQAFGLSLCMDVYRAGGGVHRKWFRMDLDAVSGEIRRAAKRAMRSLSLRQAIKFGLEKRQVHSPRLRRIIAVSEMVKRHFLECYDVPERKIVVIHNGVDLERFHPSNREKFNEEVRSRFGIKDEIVVLCVANNFKLKGVRPLIKSLAMLDGDRKFVALIVGRDKQGPYVSLARQLGCEDHVIFAGGASDVEKFYAATDICVHPTFYDPCANVCLEALASGVPTITTRLNGSGEIITEGKEGFVIDTPKDVEAMADRIRRFGNEEFRREAGRAARALAEQHSIERNVEDVMRVYEDVLAEKRAEE